MKDFDCSVVEEFVKWMYREEYRIIDVRNFIKLLDYLQITHNPNKILNKYFMDLPLEKLMDHISKGELTDELWNHSMSKECPKSSAWLIKISSPWEYIKTRLNNTAELMASGESIFPTIEYDLCLLILILTNKGYLSHLIKKRRKIIMYITLFTCSSVLRPNPQI